jgi:prepilin signal peptidase PulO-like enzyme (type II secretory pathway)
VQLLVVASFVYFWLNPPKALALPLSLIVLIYFALIIVIDIEHRLILFPTSVFGAALGLFVGTSVYAQAFEYPLPSALGASLLGGIIGFALMYLFYQLGALLTRYRARRLRAMGHEDDGEEALGGGDVYLAGILGLMLGSRFIINGLIYGILLGGLVGLLLFVAFRLRSNSSRQALMMFIPYGPSLIAGAFIMLFLG